MMVIKCLNSFINQIHPHTQSDLEISQIYPGISVFFLSSREKNSYNSVVFLCVCMLIQTFSKQKRPTKFSMFTVNLILCLNYPLGLSYRKKINRHQIRKKSDQIFQSFRRKKTILSLSCLFCWFFCFFSSFFFISLVERLESLSLDTYQIFLALTHIHMKHNFKFFFCLLFFFFPSIQQT